VFPSAAFEQTTIVTSKKGQGKFTFAEKKIPKENRKEIAVLELLLQS